MSCMISYTYIEHDVIRYITAGCQVQLTQIKQKELKKTHPSFRLAILASLITAPADTDTENTPKKTPKKKSKKTSKKKTPKKKTPKKKTPKKKTPEKKTPKKKTPKKKKKKKKKKFLDRTTTSATPSEAASDDESRSVHIADHISLSCMISYIISYREPYILVLYDSIYYFI